MSFPSYQCGVKSGSIRHTCDQPVTEGPVPADGRDDKVKNHIIDSVRSNQPAGRYTEPVEVASMPKAEINPRQPSRLQPTSTY
jgi:hypothetical protein